MSSSTESNAAAPPSHNKPHEFESDGTDGKTCKCGFSVYWNTHSLPAVGKSVECATGKHGLCRECSCPHHESSTAKLRESFECDRCGDLVTRARKTEVDICEPCRKSLAAARQADAPPERIWIGTTEHQTSKIYARGGGNFSLEQDKYSPDTDTEYVRADRDECKWTFDSVEWEANKWDSDCGDSYYFVEGGPEENKMKFCCYCGKKLKEVVNVE